MFPFIFNIEMLSNVHFDSLNLAKISWAFEDIALENIWKSNCNASLKTLA